jgi:hypothetical protein
VFAEAGHDDHGHGHENAPDHGAAFDGVMLRKKKERPISYTKYKKLFKEICAGIDNDGRRELLFEILSAHDDRVPGCEACKPLMRTFMSACRTSSKKKPKKLKDGEAPPEKQDGKQREPNIYVSDALSRAFITIAGDEENVHKTLPALDYLLAFLRTSDGKSAAAAEYFSIFADYLEAPFTEARTAVKRRQEKEEKLMVESSSDPFKRNLDAKDMDALFDF